MLTLMLTVIEAHQVVWARPMLTSVLKAKSTIEMEHTER
jgi:hypothetical protein